MKKFAIIMGLCRHLLTTAGGAMVAFGVTQDKADSVANMGMEAMGAVTALVGVFFSIKEKFKRKKEPEVSDGHAKAK